MFSNLTAFLPFLQLLSSSSASQQHILENDDTGPFNSRFSRLAKETLDLFHVPGLSIAVVDGDSVWAEVGWISFPLLHPKYNSLHEEEGKWT